MFKRQLISFYPGGSGHFLAQFLSHDWTKHRSDSGATFRLDSHVISELQSQSSQIYFVGGGRFTDHYNTADRDKVFEVLDHSNNQTIITHYLNISDFRKYTDDVWVRKIFPKTNIFGMIKNNQIKKHDLELIDYTSTNLSTRVDNIFSIMHELYNDIHKDKDLPDDLIINFGSLYDIDYLVDQHKYVHGYEPSNTKIDWAQQYISLQFDPIEDCDYTDIEQIIDYLQPADYFDVALVLYLYEKNNNTIDSGRLWSIDELPNTVNEAIEFFRSNAKKYNKF